MYIKNQFNQNINQNIKVIRSDIGK